MLAFREACPQGRFVIIVPTISLLDQWYVSLREDLGVPEESIACFSGEEKPRGVGVVNLVVVNTARNIAPAIAEKNDTFLIVDECHRVGSPANSGSLRGRHAACLGLSATPERQYDDGFEVHIAPALGDVIYEYDYAEAFADQVICPFHLVNVRVKLLDDEQRRFDQLSQRIGRETRTARGDARDAEHLKRLLRRRSAVSAMAVMRVPIAAKLVDQHRGERSIVFHERIEKANVLHKILAERNHSVAVYHSGVCPHVRRDNLRLYRHRMFDVLVTCRALDEGTNVPETSVAVIASSTASLRQRIQRLGRVLRPAPGKHMATVYTIYASDQEEKRLLDESRDMTGIADVTWQRGYVNSDGAYSD